MTKELSEEENLWLRSLTDQLEEKEAEKLIEEYKNYKDNPLYQSMMDAKKNEGELQGEARVNALHAKLLKAGRIEDVLRATEDKEYQHKLFEEFGL